MGVLGEEETLKRLAQDQTAQQQRLTQVREAAAAQQTALDTLRPRLDEAPRVFQALQAVRQQEVEARQRVGAARQIGGRGTRSRNAGDDLRSSRRNLAPASCCSGAGRDAFGVTHPGMITEIAHSRNSKRKRTANLQQLTGGRNAVRLDPQREPWRATVQETWISSSGATKRGTRPYEYTVGGESVPHVRLSPSGTHRSHACWPALRHAPALAVRRRGLRLS